MKIYIDRIPQEGVRIQEAVAAASLDLDTDIVKFQQPIEIQAQVSRITNTVTVELALQSKIRLTCSRCLEDYEVELNKNLRLGYPVEKQQHMIDLSQDLREEIVLDYPIKPLCKVSCKGLCPKCGKNLNQEKCTCKNPED